MLLCNRLLLSLVLLIIFTKGIAQEIPASSFYTNFTNTHFINTSGKAFKPAQLIGKVALFNFVYTKCSNVCPTQTKQLVEVYNSFPKEYQGKIVFVSVSLDSQYDKPKVLDKYAKQMNAEFKDWLFLSGTYDDIKSLQDKLFLFGNPVNPTHPKLDITQLKTKQKEEVLKKHMTILWVVDKNGTLIQRYAASPMDEPRLKTELKQIADL